MVVSRVANTTQAKSDHVRACIQLVTTITLAMRAPLIMSSDIRNKQAATHSLHYSPIFSIQNIAFRSLPLRHK